LDQKIYCACGWCGLDSVMLTEREAERLREAPVQMRLL
jgi:hypothetical protein